MIYLINLHINIIVKSLAIRGQNSNRTITRQTAK